MNRRIFVLAFWLATASIFVLASLPHPPEFPKNVGDKAQHIAAFATLTILGTIAFPRLRPAFLLGGLTLFGASIELVQAIPALHRSSHLMDWVADVVAVLITLAIISMLRRIVPARSRR